jgi:hypothetical protein
LVLELLVQVDGTREIAAIATDGEQGYWPPSLQIRFHVRKAPAEIVRISDKSESEAAS